MSKRRRHLAVYTVSVAVVLLCGLLAVSCYQCRVAPRTALPAETPIIRVLIVETGTGESIGVSTTGPYEIHAGGSVVTRSMAPLPESELSRRSGRWYFRSVDYTDDELAVVAVGQSYVRIDSQPYRGKVVFADDDGGILAVNHLDMESYLAGVLARELYQSWHIRAYQAQAIAARTYAFYEMGTFGRTHRYDLRADQASQVYGGSRAETDKARQAVQATRGIVLADGPEGNEKVFKAYYSSCCGGMTNSAYVLSGPPITTGPLSGGQKCEDCKASSRHRWPAVTIPKDIIYRALRRRYRQVAELGGLRTIEVAEQERPGSDFPRPVWINVVGTNGRKVRIRADDLRISLLRDGQAQGLYSMNCRIRDTGPAIVFDRGHGFGHGVGLCQWGAQGKALRGYSVQKILSAYYPGAKLFQSY